MNIAIILASVTVATLGHAFLKKGAMTLSLSTNHPETVGLLERAVALMVNPYLILGISFHVVALGIWIIALKRSEVSFALPFQSLGYVIMLLLGWYWFGETITPAKLTGIGIIVFGVIVLAQG